MTNHLVGHHAYRAQREPSPTHPAKLVKSRTKLLEDEYLAVPVLAGPEDPGEPYGVVWDEFIHGRLVFQLERLLWHWRFAWQELQFECNFCAV